MQPSPQTKSPAGGRGVFEQRTNGFGLQRKRSANGDLARIVLTLMHLTTLVECAATVLLSGQRVSAAGRDVLLHSALRLREIREVLRER